MWGFCASHRFLLRIAPALLSDGKQPDLSGGSALSKPSLDILVWMMRWIRRQRRGAGAYRADRDAMKMTTTTMTTKAVEDGPSGNDGARGRWTGETTVSNGDRRSGRRRDGVNAGGEQEDICARLHLFCNVIGREWAGQSTWQAGAADGHRFRSATIRQGGPGCDTGRAACGARTRTVPWRASMAEAVCNPSFSGPSSIRPR